MEKQKCLWYVLGFITSCDYAAEQFRGRWDYCVVFVCTRSFNFFVISLQGLLTGRGASVWDPDGMYISLSAHKRSESYSSEGRFTENHTIVALGFWGVTLIDDPTLITRHNISSLRKTNAKKEKDRQALLPWRWYMFSWWQPHPIITLLFLGKPGTAAVPRTA